MVKTKARLKMQVKVKIMQIVLARVKSWYGASCSAGRITMRAVCEVGLRQWRTGGVGGAVRTVGLIGLALEVNFGVCLCSGFDM